MNKYHLIGFLCIMLFLTGGVIAQEETAEAASEDCPTIVETALELTKTLCDETDLNEACYGHVAMEAEARLGVEVFEFDTPGDRANVDDVQTLQLSAMDEATGQWGVLNVKVLAVPSEGSEVEAGTPMDVQLLLFGDVEMNDATQFVWVQARDRVNVREIPTTNSAVVTSLQAGERVIANRRLEDNSWLRVRTSSEEGGLGWVFTEFIETGEDVEVLDVVPVEDALEGVLDERANYGPMQAFFFASGRDDNPCAEAPESGMLIQTPEGVASVTIWMDEVVIQLDGTAVIQADAGGDLTVGIVDGEAQVEAMGESTTLLAGTQATVPLNDNLLASDVPSDPEPLSVGTLPTEALDDEVTVADPLNIVPGQPLEGRWLFSWGVELATCPDGTEVPLESTGNTGDIRLQEGGFVWGATRYNEVTQGVYSATYSDGNGNLHQDTLSVIAPDTISGEKIIDLVSPLCTLEVPFSIKLQGNILGG